MKTEIHPWNSGVPAERRRLMRTELCGTMPRRRCGRIKELHGTLFDGLGLAASSFCVVHCIGTTALSFLLPALGLTFLADERIHHVLAVTVVVAGLLAFVPGFRLHRSWPIAIFAALGLSAIALSQLWLDEARRERFETALTIFGGGMLVIAHWQNRVLCRECRCRECGERK